MTVHPAFPTSAGEVSPLTVRIVDPLALSPDLAAAWDRLAGEEIEPINDAFLSIDESAVNVLAP